MSRRDDGREQVKWPARSGAAVLGPIRVNSGSKKEEGGRNPRKDFLEAILDLKNDMKILYCVLCIQKLYDDTRVSFYDVNSCG